MPGTSVYTSHYNVSNNNTKIKKIAKVSVSYEQKNNYH
jgi:hypothetical protein